jgi:hypothetical protein
MLAKEGMLPKTENIPFSFPRPCSLSSMPASSAGQRIRSGSEQAIALNPPAGLPDGGDPIPQQGVQDQVLVITK